jgi:hypothetical protein
MRQNHRLPDEIESVEEAAKFLIQLYKEGYALSRLAREYGVSYRTIKKLLIANNVQIRTRRRRNLQNAKNPSWESAFKQPTREALYWAGFLMADGSIIRQGDNEPSIRCALKSSDRIHVEHLASFVGRGEVVQKKRRKPIRLGRFIFRNSFRFGALGHRSDEGAEW